jgi:hypothetical protein
MILLSFGLLLATLAVAVGSLVDRSRGWQPSVEARRPELIAASATLVIAAIVSAFLMFGPMMASRSTSVASDGTTATGEQRLTLLQSGELVILPILAVVLALAATPLLLRRRRSRYWVGICGAFVLGGFSIVAGFSIGLFFQPVAWLMFFAALLGRGSPTTA